METIKWVFSGIGVWIIGLFGGNKKERDVVSQAQSAGDKSTNIQAKGDVNFSNIQTKGDVDSTNVNDEQEY